MSAVKNGYKRWMVPRTQRVPSPNGTCTSSVLQKKVPGCPAGNPLMYRLSALSQICVLARTAMSAWAPVELDSELQNGVPISAAQKLKSSIRTKPSRQALDLVDGGDRLRVG